MSILFGLLVLAGVLVAVILLYKGRGGVWRHLTPRARLWLWVSVAVICLLGGGLRVWQNHRRRDTRKAWRVRRGQLNQFAAQARARVRALWRSRQHPEQWTRAELEAEINDGMPLPLSSQGDRQIARWKDPASGRFFELRFRNGQWTGYSSSWNSSQGPRLAPPSAGDRATETVRALIAGRSFCYPGAILWSLLLLLSLAWRRCQPAIAELMLATAVVTTVAWLVAPNYSLTWRGISSNDMLFGGVAMLVVSIFALVTSTLEARARKRKIDAELFCPTCLYDLTGNVSGVCPECGNPVPQALRDRIQARGVQPA